MTSMKQGIRQRCPDSSTICLDVDDDDDDDDAGASSSSASSSSSVVLLVKDHKSSTHRPLLLRPVVRSILPIMKKRRRLLVTTFICLCCFIVISTLKVIALVMERKFVLPNACQVASNSKLYLAQQQNPLTPDLPKIIHQVWKDDNIPSGRFADVHAAWKRLFPEPEYQHILWTDETGRNLVEKEFSWFLPTYDSYPMNIQRADAMRYFILYKYGGVYADLDYEPLVNFWDYFPKDRVSLIESPYILNERVQNSLMASPPQHAFWNASFQILEDHAHDESLLASTGPAAMDATIDVYTNPENSSPNDDDDVGPYILPCQNFQRIPIFGLEFRQLTWLAQFFQLRRFYSREVKSCGDWTRTNDCQFGIHHNSVSYLDDLIRHDKEVQKKKRAEKAAARQ